MSFPESDRDLLNGQVATLATIGGDGFPQVTEIWFLYDEGELKLSLHTTRLKTRNLGYERRVAGTYTIGCVRYATDWRRCRWRRAMGRASGAVI